MCAAVPEEAHSRPKTHNVPHLSPKGRQNTLAYGRECSWRVERQTRMGNCYLHLHGGVVDQSILKSAGGESRATIKRIDAVLLYVVRQLTQVTRM